mgnify:CR=1 FL=1
MNDIRILELSQNILLEELMCNGNEISELDLRNNIKLMNVDCSYNNIKTLDINKDFTKGLVLIMRFALVTKYGFLMTWLEKKQSAKESRKKSLR